MAPQAGFEPATLRLTAKRESPPFSVVLCLLKVFVSPDVVVMGSLRRCDTCRINRYQPGRSALRSRRMPSSSSAFVVAGCSDVSGRGPSYLRIVGSATPVSRHMAKGCPTRRAHSHGVPLTLARPTMIAATRARLNRCAHKRPPGCAPTHERLAFCSSRRSRLITFSTRVMARMPGHGLTKSNRTCRRIR